MQTLAGEEADLDLTVVELRGFHKENKQLVGKKKKFQR